MTAAAAFPSGPASGPAGTIWRGNYDLVSLLRAIEDCDEDPENARLHPADNMAGIKQSLQTFGQAKPVTVWYPSPHARPIVIAGNGTMRGARELGWTHIAATVFSGSRISARAFAIADNKIPELAQWDTELLAAQTQEISAAWEAESSAVSWDSHAAFSTEGVAAVDVVTTPRPERAPSEPAPIKPNTAAADGLSTREREARQTETIEAEFVETHEVGAKPGDLFALGRHRILCGDSTSAAAVARLMGGERAALLHADPPYGMTKEGVTNDDLHGEKLDAFQWDWWRACRPVLTENAASIIWGNPYPLWSFWFHKLNALSPFAEDGPPEALAFRNEIVWDKGTASGGQLSDEMRSFAISTERALFFMLGEQKFNTNADHYWEGWEPLRAALAGELERAGWSNKRVAEITGTMMYKHWFTRSQWVFITEANYLKLQNAGRELGVFQIPYREIRSVFEAAKTVHDGEVKEAFYKSRSYFDNTHDNMTEVWCFPRVVGDERWGHTTPKPVALCSRAIKSGCPEGGVVLEPFAGSGSTLMAAEETGRRCFTMELEPRFVATTVRRWEQATGERAELLP